MTIKPKIMMNLYFSDAYKQKYADELKAEFSEDKQSMIGISLLHAKQKMLVFDNPGEILENTTSKNVMLLLQQRANTVKNLSGSTEMAKEQREQVCAQIDYINEQIKKLLIL